MTVPLSLPARSISESLPVKVSFSVFLILDYELTIIWKTAWEREDVKLALVDSVVRLLFPKNNRFITYSVDSALYSVTPAIVIPF